MVITAGACGQKPEMQNKFSSPASTPAKTAIPTRIVSLAPNLTEMIYVLGAEDSLIGVTQYCKFPPEAKKKPKVGALVNMDYEKLRALKPDLVLLLPGQSEVAQKLKQLGIASASFRSETISDIEKGMQSLGEMLGRSGQAQIATTRLQKRMSDLRQKTKSRLAGSENQNAQSPPRVLFVIGRNPGSLQQIYGCGSGNYLDELLQAVGAVNVLGKTDLPWPVVGKESIIKLDPDVILDGSLRGGDAPVDGDYHMKAWEQLGMLSSVKNHRVIAVGDEHLLVPGPGFADDAEKLADAIFIFEKKSQ